MRVWDKYGRLLMSYDNFTEMDMRYLRKDSDDSFDRGIKIGFDDVDGTLKFYNGKLYLKNQTDNLYYEVVCLSADNVPTLAVSDTGVVL